MIWLTTSEVAEKLGMSQGAVYRAIKDGWLKAEKYNGRWRVEDFEVKRILGDREQAWDIGWDERA